MRRASKENKHIKIESQNLLSSNNNSFFNDKNNDILFNKDEDEEKKEENSYINSINDIALFFKDKIHINNIILDIDEIKRKSTEKIVEEYQKIINLISDFEEFLKNISDNEEKKNTTNQRNKNINISEYEQKINNYKNQIEKMSTSLDKEISTNNKNLIIINSQNRIIEKLQQDLIFKEIPEYKMKLSRKINRKLNLSINKDKENSKIINNNSIYKSNRGISSKAKGRKTYTESSGITSLIQPTNASFGFNNSFIKVNTPMRIPTEENSTNKF